VGQTRLPCSDREGARAAKARREAIPKVVPKSFCARRLRAGQATRHHRRSLFRACSGLGGASADDPG
jgi:hypothetical protein